MHRARLPLQSCPFSLWQLNPACICAGWGGVWLRISCPRDFYTYFFQKQWTFVHLGKRVFSLSIGNLSFNSAGTSFVKVSKLSSHSPGATDHPFPSHLPCQGGLSLNSCPAPSLSHECLPEGVKKKGAWERRWVPFVFWVPTIPKCYFLGCFTASAFWWAQENMLLVIIRHFSHYMRVAFFLDFFILSGGRNSYICIAI